MGATAFAPLAAKAATCLATPAQTEGPYFVEENLNRPDIRTDPATGAVSPGISLKLKLNVSLANSAGCGPLSNARVEIWHCDASGSYSDEAANRTQGKKFLRGYQVTDGNGDLNFTTIYPGWYQGRAVHIHFKVRTYNGTAKLGEFTSQFFFDDVFTDKVFTLAPYNARGRRDTLNSTDGIFRGTSNNDRLMAKVAEVSGGYEASIDLAVNLQTPTVAKAVLTSGGVVNAGSFQAGIAPGAWITIFGKNLASTTKAVSTDDLVNGTLPTTMGGVSVKIDGKDAFLQYVSPTQINVQAPADENAGSVAVTVTNGAGVSDAVTTMLQPVFPAFFVSGGYVAAVRGDGSVLSASNPAKAGETISLYGNGFGATNPGLAPGKVASAAAPVTNPVRITIGGVVVDAQFAGLSSTGLYQFNVAVPPMSGDQEVVAEIAGQHTQSGVLLRVQP